MTRPDTQELLRIIEEMPNVDNAVKELANYPKAKTFPVALFDFLQERGMTIPELCEASLLSRSFTYQLCEGTRAPGRDIVLRLAIVLGLTYDEAQYLLRSAQRGALYPRVRRDAVIIYALAKHMNLTETNEALLSLGEESLL